MNTLRIGVETAGFVTVLGVGAEFGSLLARGVLTKEEIDFDPIEFLAGSAGSAVGIAVAISAAWFFSEMTVKKSKNPFGFH